MDGDTVISFWHIIKEAALTVNTDPTSTADIPLTREELALYFTHFVNVGTDFITAVDKRLDVMSKSFDELLTGYNELKGGYSALREGYASLRDGYTSLHEGYTTVSNQAKLATDALSSINGRSYKIEKALTMISELAAKPVVVSVNNESVGTSEKPGESVQSLDSTKSINPKLVNTYSVAKTKKWLSSAWTYVKQIAEVTGKSKGTALKELYS